MQGNQFRITIALLVMSVLSLTVSCSKQPSLTQEEQLFHAILEGDLVGLEQICSSMTPSVLSSDFGELDQRTPLVVAVESQNVTGISLLLDHGADPMVSSPSRMFFTGDHALPVVVCARYGYGAGVVVFAQDPSSDRYSTSDRERVLTELKSHQSVDDYASTHEQLVQVGFIR